jgi:multidrug resistance efflux pump
LAAVLVAAIGLVLNYRAQLATRFRPGSPVAVRTAEVRSGTIEQTIRLTGATVAERSVYLRAPYLRGRRSVGGPGDFGLALEELTAPGKRIKKGDQVAAFDRMSMLNRLDDYRAARVDRELRVRTMRAELDVKRVAYQQQIRVAKATMDKAALDLKTAPVRSAIQVALFQLAFEEARATYEALLAQAKYIEVMESAEVRLAQLELQEARVEERRAEANVDKMVVRAPVDGLVVVTEIFRGSEFGQIQAGDQLRPGQPYAQIVDPRSMIVEATANQVDVENLRIGARAHLLFDAYSDLELAARVYSIGPLAKGRGWRTNYVPAVSVFLKLDRVDPRLIPNLTVSADVILHRESSDGIVPREAVFHVAEDGQPFAYVRTPDGWEKRELELGLANNIEVAVHSGLSPGEVVAVSEPSA